MIETVRLVLPERGLERGCRFMIVANLLDDMWVHLLFNGFGRDAERVFDRKRGAGAVGNDANAVHAQERAAAVLLIIGLLFDGVEGVPREKRARFSHWGARQ